MNKGMHTPGWGYFGEWMASTMKAKGWTVQKLADRLHCRANPIYNHIRKSVRPSYITVTAYCHILKEDPDKAWKLVEKDWGDIL